MRDFLPGRKETRPKFKLRDDSGNAWRKCEAEGSMKESWAVSEGLNYRDGALHLCLIGVSLNDLFRAEGIVVR